MSVLEPPIPTDMPLDGAEGSSDSVETLLFHFCSEYCTKSQFGEFFDSLRENKSLEPVNFTLWGIHTCPNVPWGDHLTQQRHCLFIFVLITAKITLVNYWLIYTKKIIRMGQSKSLRPTPMSIYAMGWSSNSVETLVFCICWNHCKNWHLVSCWVTNTLQTSPHILQSYYLTLESAEPLAHYSLEV